MNKKQRNIKTHNIIYSFALPSIQLRKHLPALDSSDQIAYIFPFVLSQICMTETRAAESSAPSPVHQFAAVQQRNSAAAAHPAAQLSCSGAPSLPCRLLQPWTEVKTPAENLSDSHAFQARLQSPAKRDIEKMTETPQEDLMQDSGIRCCSEQGC